MMEYRNVVAREGGAYDCEVAHPKLGWIEYFAVPNDVDEFGARLHNAIVGDASDYGPAAPFEQTVPENVSRIKIKRALVRFGLWETFKAALSLNADMKEDWELTNSVPRRDPLVLGMAAGLGMTSSEVDSLFLLAETL